MEIVYRKLTKKELDTFIQMRIRQLREEGATEDIDLVPSLQDYYRRHMADGTFVSWLAMDREKIVGTSGMSFVEKPPYFGCPSGKMGLLSSMFTDPDYRRKGYGREGLMLLMNAARNNGIIVLYDDIALDNIAVKLFKGVGFTEDYRTDEYIMLKCDLTGINIEQENDR